MMTDYPHGLLCKVCILAQSPSPSLPPSSSSIWNSPIIGPIAGALITTIVGGISVKLWWNWREAEIKLIKSEKDTAINNKNLEIERKNLEIERKNLEIKRLEDECEDELRNKAYEIKELNTEIARLKLECPPSIKEGYETLRASTLQLYEETKKKYDEVNNKLIEKEQQIEILRSQEKENLTLLDKLEFEKQELLTRQKIFEEISTTLETFGERMKSLQGVMLWIDTNREELVESSTEYVLSNFPQLLGNTNEENRKDLVLRFKHNVDDYVDWIRFSLENGCPINLSRVNLQPAVSGSALAKAFEFIKNQRAAQELPDNLANELGAFINDLIAYFSSSAFRQ